MIDPVNFEGRLYCTRHGGAFDRGSADSHYNRPFDPHYYTGATYSTARVELSEQDKLYADYAAGYAWNERYGDKKNWG